MIENAAPMRVSEMTRMIPEPQSEASAQGKKGDDDERGADTRDGGDGEVSDSSAGAESDTRDGEDGAPRRRRSRTRRPRRENAEEGELAPADG